MSTELHAEAITALTGILLPDSTFDETMQRLVEVACSAVPTADLAGMTLIGEDGVPATPYFTDDLSPHVDQVQYETGRGPCLDAWRRDRPIVVNRLDEVEGHYPEFAATARRSGVGSVLGIPLRAGEARMGALNLYAVVPGVFVDEDLTAAARIAELIGVTIANASAYWRTFELSRQLEEALRSRAIIEQAKGVIMATTGVDADDAFTLLREQSQAENRKLRDIARELVDRQRRDQS